ncbi:hypothetical protein DFP93_101264 [Aneurinibacillus soli]|uniref:Uncharacterized protein n=1 Tax=Aneurinibacillus soli TaxID=1500254 RepID=A0A0U4WHN2_9BACL|nr:hypothetical protein [Aneurinibacillus soli]PYE64238.1 hypothetical protein DFP93_101264 [Aneurinibacillus soli]BAU28187.1 hypothetical protein CB4_02361 [Aneurinibacillus soli]
MSVSAVIMMNGGGCVSHEFYITPEEYKRAQQNGIDAANLERRIHLLGWKKERAMNTPLREKLDRGEWAKIAEQNGIKYDTFMSRVNVYGWDEERAATQPLQDRKAAALKGTEKNRVYDPAHVELAAKNGIAYHTFVRRIKRGWDSERAATEPVMTASTAGRKGKEKTIELYGDWNRFSFK